MSQGGQKSKFPWKGSVSGNTQVKYQSSSTHYSTVSFQKVGQTPRLKSRRVLYSCEISKLCTQCSKVINNVKFLLLKNSNSKVKVTR